MIKKICFTFSVSLVLVLGLAFSVSTAFAQADDQDYIELLSKNDQGIYSKHGWNHYGPGCFTLDRKTGVLQSHNGMGVFWYSAKQFGDFVLELDFMCSAKETNSGVFLRMPNMISSNDYIFESFEIQIYDADLDKKDHVMHEGAAKMDPSMLHTTGAVYDAEPPKKKTSLGPNKWNHYKITCKGIQYTIELNGELVNDWMAEPRGKVKTHWPKGYIGLQNHDATSSVYFRNIRIKEL
jgi:3-keto-disaccharide hydrolase